MLASTTTNNRPQPVMLVQDALGYDFAVLGLPARECRTEVIRRAAGETSIRIQELAAVGEEQTEMLSHLVSSTYRLLDPRRRQHHMERVHLSLLTDADWDRQRLSRKPFEPRVASRKTDAIQTKSRNLVVAELVEHSPFVAV